MSKSLNRVELIGNVGRDPELKYTSSGVPVCRFSMATSEEWTDDAGQKQSRTEWHSCIAWRKVAEIVNQYVKKGSKLRVEGVLRTHEYVPESGPNKGSKQKLVQIDVQDVMFLGAPKDASKEPIPAAAGNGSQAVDDDVPF
jgi:single-strand DNA-binding protein